ncbi:MAG: hypothetical protein NTW65_07370 [Deltaproteobacteria bacterium]|nr:hypothetical protein [Deltaproteobacteria bacterium]
MIGTNEGEMNDTHKAELENDCKELFIAFQGMLSWKWDSRFDTVLAEFDVANKDSLRQILERYLKFTWNSSNIKKAHRSVIKVNSCLGNLMSGQMIFTSDPNGDAYIYCAWWPWGNGKTISIRIGPCYKELPDPEKAEKIQQFKKWFGIKSV